MWRRGVTYLMPLESEFSSWLSCMLCRCYMRKAIGINYAFNADLDYPKQKTKEEWLADRLNGAMSLAQTDSTFSQEVNGPGGATAAVVDIYGPHGGKFEAVGEMIRIFGEAQKLMAATYEDYCRSCPSTTDAHNNTILCMLLDSYINARFILMGLIISDYAEHCISSSENALARLKGFAVTDDVRMRIGLVKTFKAAGMLRKKKKELARILAGEAIDVLSAAFNFAVNPKDAINIQKQGLRFARDIFERASELA